MRDIEHRTIIGGEDRRVRARAQPLGHHANLGNQRKLGIFMQTLPQTEF